LAGPAPKFAPAPATGGAIPLAAALAVTSGLCSECGRCVQECRFLQRHGTPKRIADSFDPASEGSLSRPYECSLCGLCSAVCPEPVEPDALFLEMRREAVRRGHSDFGEYAGLLGYERTGVSRHFTWYGLPAGCDTIFFPGCALPGTRPAQTRQVFTALQSQVPALGIVFDCCTKPSHDLGRQDYFSAMFGELCDYLVAQGVRTVLTACPNCYQVFQQYAPEFAVHTVYETLAGGGIRPPAAVAGTVTIHDPCVIRHAAPAQEAVRTLVAATGATIAEMPHNRQTTLCCGAGGAVDCREPQLAAQWGEQRRREAAGRRTVTYCAGCSHRLGAHTPTSHVVDLLTAPAAALAGKAKVSRTPFTYLNRLRLKRRFRATLPVAASRERTFTGGVRRYRMRLYTVLEAVALLAEAVAERSRKIAPAAKSE
jgi:Fe-S oxidoreductase